MSIRSLADFLEKLDTAGQLRRVSVEVFADQELTEIVRRVAQRSGPALIFQKITGSQVPLAANLLATEQRIAIALGTESLDAVATRLPGAAGGMQNGGWLDWLKAGFQASIDSFGPRAVRTAACQQVVRLGRDVDLTELPALRLSQHDTQPSLLGVCVISSGPEAGERVLGAFDLPIIDRSRLAIRWGPHDPIGRQFAACRAAGVKLPVAVILGGTPSLSIAAVAAPREPSLDPLLLAGLLGAEAVDVVSCRTVALQVPADAEIVIEGAINPQAAPLTDAAPGTCGGFGLLPTDAYEIQVSALTQRSTPLATAAMPHAPLNEASALARAVARLWLPATRRLIPALVDLDLPATIRAGQMAVLSIRKQFPGEARQVAAAWWGQPAAATTKIIVIVDAEVEVCDTAAIWSEVAAQADPSRDVFCFDGPIDHRDFSASNVAIGPRMAIDATTKVPGEQSRGWPSRSAVSEDAHQRVEALWRAMGWQ